MRRRMRPQCASPCAFPPARKSPSVTQCDGVTESSPMSGWTATDRRVGMWSALTVVGLGVAYVLTGVVWFATRSASSVRAELHPGDPYRAILETLIVLSVPAMLVVMVAVHRYAAPASRSYSTTALAF